MKYQAKLQLRPDDKELLTFVKKLIREYKVTIVKEDKLKEGIDLYIDSNKFAVSLAKKFRNKYKVKPKVTRSLYTEDKQKGKRIHRLTVLLRMPKPL